MGVVNATVTGKTGPNQTATAAVLTNCRGANFDADSMVLSIEDEDGSFKEFDLVATTTVTLTKSGTTFTLTVT